MRLREPNQLTTQSYYIILERVFTLERFSYLTKCNYIGV